MAVMVVVGLGSTGFQMLNNALQMSETDPAYYGRVMSLTMLAWGSQSITALPYGFLADEIGERSALLVMGLAVLGLLALSSSAWAAVRRTASHPATTPTVDAPGLGIMLPQKSGLPASGGD
jgi:MFS family permease